MSKKVAEGSAFTRVVSVNVGERDYMRWIYTYMSVALGISAVVAWFFARTGLTRALFSSPLGFVVTFIPLGMSFYLMSSFHRMSSRAVAIYLMSYAAAMGVSMSGIFLMFRMGDIAQVFFITMAMFAGMSIYGLTTRTNLASFGSVVGMFLWGVLIASLVNIFMHSSGFAFLLSIVSVGLFSFLVAMDTQMLRQLYYVLGGDSEDARKVSVFGALRLYMSVIVIFMNLLQILGMTSNRRD